jgi:hypothetical protein
MASFRCSSKRFAISKVDFVYQLLGREYYQTSFGESYLLLAPLGCHIAAGLTRRGLIWFRKITRSKELHLTKPSLLVTTAYVAMALVPIHFLVNREYPSIDEAPIFGLSPSQLNFEYVKFGLDRWPVRSWLLYGLMVPAVCLHGAEGMMTICRKRLRPSLHPGGWLRYVASTASFLALAGLFTMSRESISVYAGEAARFLAAYTKSTFYR